MVQPDNFELENQFDHKHRELKKKKIIYQQRPTKSSHALML